jgi:hypothetical protein
MGLVIRHAERLGLHRDGTLFNLLPVETETRRSIWWQLQHLDLALAVQSGSASLTLMADWDVQLPSNIEDRDISPDMRSPPPERPGMTTMSYCLWSYWVLQQQRNFRAADGSRLGISWIADKNLSRQTTESFISQLEYGLNHRFIQFCDPLNPLDTFLQITARSFIATMKRLVLHSLIHRNVSTPSERPYDERQLVELCMRCLEYYILLRCSPSLVPFKWGAQGYFPWSACKHHISPIEFFHILTMIVVYVVVDAWRQYKINETERIWSLIGDVYAANPILSNFDDDPRKPRIAEIIVAVWNSQVNDSNRNFEKPAVVADLETLLATRGQPKPTSRGNEDVQDQTSSTRVDTTYDMQKSFANPVDLNSVFDWTFNDIDWSFWGGLDCP